MALLRQCLMELRAAQTVAPSMKPRRPNEASDASERSQDVLACRPDLPRAVPRVIPRHRALATDESMRR